MFPCLSGLSIHNFARGEDTFFEGLVEVHHLTKLHFYRLGGGRLRAFAECMSSFTGLRSLTLRDDYQTILPEIAERLTILTQLTELSLDSIKRSRSLRLPTGIVNLQLGYAVKYAAASPGINEYLPDLTSLTNLTSLSIKSSEELRLFQPGGVTPSQFSRQLRGLKDLKTSNVLMDELFLDALTTLTQLTQLCLDSLAYLADPYIVCPRLSSLSNLEVLKISYRKNDVSRRFAFPQMRLPKLKELELPFERTSASARRELWQTLPCLRKFMLFGKTLAYE